MTEIDIVARVTAGIRDYVRRQRLIAAGETVVVAVSGGADSLCLLYVLYALQSELDCRLRVAHLDHMLRPTSHEDAAFVAAQASALGLPCTVEQHDVAALAHAQRVSLETAGRLARYGFLRAVSAVNGAHVIATGHTRDDQAETLLLHLMRGSGLGGLTGMSPRRDDIIRPLLETSRNHTAAYCAARGLLPREDETNRVLAYRRNYLRHEVMPRLEALQPAAGANIARAARLLAADLALIERMARRALEHATLERQTGRAVLSIERWAEAEAELRPHMWRLLLGDMLGHAQGFAERHYTAMDAALDRQGRDDQLSLPHGLVLIRRGAIATLGCMSAPLPALDEHTLPVPGAVDTVAGRIEAALATAPYDWTVVPSSVAYLDRAAAGAALTVRGWRPGDRIRPLGLHGTRKVQDLFVDRKVPREERARIPIVEGPRGIAWVAGLCVAEPYRAVSGAAAVRLSWHENNYGAPAILR